MTALNKQALLIENGQLVADTLRHLADNEIDSDYFAITSTNENGTEIDHELVITDYARQAAGTVDELVKALEAADKLNAELNQRNTELTAKIEPMDRCIAELEARTVKLPEYRNSPDMHTKQFYEAIGFNQGLDVFIEALRAAGIGVKGE